MKRIVGTIRSTGPAAGDNLYIEVDDERIRQSGFVPGERVVAISPEELSRLQVAEVAIEVSVASDSAREKVLNAMANLMSRHDEMMETLRRWVGEIK